MPIRPNSRVRGFSLLEMMAVVAVIMVLAAIAIPGFMRAYYNIRLRAAASDLSALMQQARMLAARRNAVNTIAYQNVNGKDNAYVDLNNNGQWDAGPPPEPIITFKNTVSLAPGPPSGTSGQPTPYVLVGDSAGVTYGNSTTLGYSPRGLPCAYVAGACNTPAAGYFVYYLTDQRPTSAGWAAVVVTRTGRSKTLLWNGTSWQ
jgi:type IV fimbrial biogenesis protein FimT